MIKNIQNSNFRTQKVPLALEKGTCLTGKRKEKRCYFHLYTTNDHLNSPVFLAFPFTISKKSSKLKNKFISKYDINLSGSHFLLLHKLRSISNLSIFVLFHLSKSQPKSILLDDSHIHFLGLWIVLLMVYI